MRTDVAGPLREALIGAGYTFDGVADVLGGHAHEALMRNETLPARRATTGGSPAETLIRLFLLQVPVSLSEAEAALPGLVDRLGVAGLLSQSVSEVAARLDCRPYATDVDSAADLWVVSDLTPGLDGGPNVVGSDHVLGISSASTSLAQLTIRNQVGRSLDLGTGCGVQALHLAQHSDRVVATDVNPRALAIARFNAALNEVHIDVREGSYFEPVRGEQYDLIATNPPFVISPATGERLVYRDSGLPGDQVVEDIVRALPSYLAPDGTGQVLANWIIERDRPWDERLAEWLDPECGALVVQRETIDPAGYVELWLKDSGHHGGGDYLQRYDTWLSWLEQSGVEAIGFGWINLRAGGTGHELLEWPYDVEQPIGPAIGDELARAGHTVDLEQRLRLRADVVQETVGAPGAEHPEAIVLRQQRGFRRARQVDTHTAAMVGACDGELTLDQIAQAIADLLGEPLDQLRDQCLLHAGELLDEGFFERG